MGWQLSSHRSLLIPFVIVSWTGLLTACGPSGVRDPYPVNVDPERSPPMGTGGAGPGAGSPGLPGGGAGGSGPAGSGGAGGATTGSGGSTSMPNTGNSGGTGGAATGGAGGSAAPLPPDAGAPVADARRDTAPAATPDTRPPDNRPPLVVTPPPQPDASPPPPDMMTVAPPDTGPNAMLPPPPNPGPGAPLTPCSGGCPGLRGEYFDNDDFTGSKFIRQDARIDFVWEDTPPDPSMDKDNFSVRWVGKIRPRFSESYTFSVEHNDNVRLWVAGKQLLNVFDNSGRRTTEAPAIQLAADQAEDILIEFRERTGDAQITMSWRSNSQDREVVPAAALFWVAPASAAP
jgi:hypothetical protein